MPAVSSPSSTTRADGWGATLNACSPTKAAVDLLLLVCPVSVQHTLWHSKSAKVSFEVHELGRQGGALVQLQRCFGATLVLRCQSPMDARACVLEDGDFFWSMSTPTRLHIFRATDHLLHIVGLGTKAETTSIN